VPDDPLWINASSGAPAYAANELRRAFAALLYKGVADRFGARQGVHPAGANAVSIAGMTVTVQHLNGVVYPGLTSLAGPYVVQLQTGTHAVPTADATNPRKDIVCLQVQDNDEDSSGFRRVQSVYVQGTPAGSPVEPAVPSGAFRMATVDVPAGSTTPTLTYNAPFTVAAGGILPVRTDAELLATAGGLYDGAARWRQDTDAFEVHNGGSAWETVGSAKGYQYWKTVTFSANGTFTKADHVGLRAVRIRCQAGGGAGGGAAATAAGEGSAGGGGEGGAYAESFKVAADLAAAETVTVGAGGTGVSGGNGNVGGTSSFGTLVSAAGGDAGTATAASATGASLSGATSTQAMTGDVQIGGGGGGACVRDLAKSFGGQGGDSAMGTGGRGAGQGIAGSNGRGYGGAGGGAANNASEAARAGGNGTGGRVLVDVYV